MFLMERFSGILFHSRIDLFGEPLKILAQERNGLFLTDVLKHYFIFFPGIGD